MARSRSRRPSTNLGYYPFDGGVLRRHFDSEHFQQKCEAVLRWTMRQKKHFQQKCEAVLRWTMRQKKHFQQKCEAVLRRMRKAFASSYAKSDLIVSMS